MRFLPWKIPLCFRTRIWSNVILLCIRLGSRNRRDIAMYEPCLATWTVFWQIPWVKIHLMFWNFQRHNSLFLIFLCLFFSVDYIKYPMLDFMCRSRVILLMAESGVYLEIFLWNLSGFWIEYTLFIFLNGKRNHTFFLGELLQLLCR